MASIFAPYERERKFFSSLNLDQIQKALWPLLTLFILLNFWDTITTFYASVLIPSFYELNPLGASLFKLGFPGFMTAYLLKFVPVVPLFYMAAFRRADPTDDFQVRLLKFAAFVVLVSADILLGAIVVGNNIPLLLEYG